MIPQIAYPSPPPIPITKERLLLAEGNTPMHFLEALLRSIAISDRVEVRNFGGIGDLTKNLRALQASAGFEIVRSIGIVRDAENDAATAHQSVESILRELKLSGESEGAIKTSIFILPDNSRQGMIEDLCLDSVRADPVYECVERFMECAATAGAPMPTGLRRAKSYAQAFLATRNEPQMFPGIAAYRNYWPMDSIAFGDLSKFLLAI
jgi:hypothetical protein